MIEKRVEGPQSIIVSASEAIKLYSGSVLQSYFRHLEEHYRYTVEIDPLTSRDRAMTIVLKCPNGKSGLFHLNLNGKPTLTCETTSEQKIEVGFYDVHYGRFAVMEKLMKQMDIPSRGFLKTPKLGVQTVPLV